MLKRAKERYERQLAGPNETRRKTSNVPVEERRLRLTRSKTTPFNSDMCFFCDGSESRLKALFNVRESSSVESLRAAIEKSGNDSLRLKLVTSLDVSDEQAAKIRYHKNCWLNNVTNVLRQQQDPTTASNNDSSTSENAAQTEFLAMTEINLREWKILIMSELQAAYESIRRANNAGNPECSRKALKQLIQDSIPEVEFHRPLKVNESERLSIRKTRDAAIHLAEKENTNGTEEMKLLFKAALLLREVINNCEKWVFSGSFEDISKENLPEELYSFFRWVLQGPNTQLLTEKKSLEVHRRALSLAQTTVCMCLTERQRNNKKSDVLQGAREMPQQVAVGLAVHQAVRSKAIVNMLYGLGMSIEYNRQLRIEAQIEADVLHRMNQLDGIYLPPDIVKDRYVFFAIDNIDFKEDTYDGQGTLHGTTMAIYQKQEIQDNIPELRYELRHMTIRQDIFDSVCFYQSDHES